MCGRRAILHTIVAAVRRETRALDPAMPMFEVETLATQVEASLRGSVSSQRCRAASGCWRCCSPASVCTASCLTPWRVARMRSAFGWRSAPIVVTCSGSCCAMRCGWFCSASRLEYRLLWRRRGSSPVNFSESAQPIRARLVWLRWRCWSSPLWLATCRRDARRAWIHWWLSGVSRLSLPGFATSIPNQIQTSLRSCKTLYSSAFTVRFCNPLSLIRE